MTSSPNLRSLFLALFWFVYAIAFGEVFLRLVKPEPIIPRFVMDGGDGIRANRPFAEYTQYTAEVTADFRINSAGMRDYREYSPESPESQCRIALLGDSQMIGYEVKFEDSIAVQLEVILREAGLSCEVLNFAVSGFGTAESLLVYENRARAFGADIVVLSWSNSDRNENYRSGLFAIQDGELVRLRNRYLPGVAIRERLEAIPVYEFLLRNSQLFHAVRRTSSRLSKVMMTYLRTSEEAADEPRSDDLHLALIEHLAGLVKDDGAQFFLLEIPSKTFVPTMPPSFFTLKDVEIIETLESAKARQNANRPLFRQKGQGHLSEAGNCVLAHEAANYLLGHAEVLRFAGMQTRHQAIDVEPCTLPVADPR